jgi:hypothetical protein
MYITSKRKASDDAVPSSKLPSDIAVASSKLPSRTSPRKGKASDNAGPSSKLPSRTSPRKGKASDNAVPSSKLPSRTTLQNVSDKRISQLDSRKRKAFDNDDTPIASIEALSEGNNVDRSGNIEPIDAQQYQTQQNAMVANVVPEKPKRRQKMNLNKATIMTAKQTMTRNNGDPFLDRLVGFATTAVIVKMMTSLQITLQNG